VPHTAAATRGWIGVRAGARSSTLGQPNREIAASLGISPKTVGHHVEHIYGKASVRSRAAATVWAFEQGLIHRQ